MEALLIPSLARKRGIRTLSLGLLIAAGMTVPMVGAEKVREELLQKDFPFLGACIGAPQPKDNVAYKGLAIRIGYDASVLFDTDLCRMTAGWTGGYIDTRGVAFDGGHGHHPNIVGEQVFGTAVVPGVAGPDAAFRDSRPEPYGPMDASVARWDGLRVNGMKVRLDYTVHGNIRIQEEPSSVKVDNRVGFVRTFHLEPPAKRGFFVRSQKVVREFSILLADVEGAEVTVNGSAVELRAGGKVTVVAGSGLPKNATIRVAKGRVALHVGEGTPVSTFKTVLWSGSESDLSGFASLMAGKPEMTDFSKGGLARWPQPVVLTGVLNTSSTPDGAYVTDSIAAPEKNPWNRRVRFGGMDFFADGKRAALCTHDGDVWIVSGINAGLEKLEWRRFASGLYEPLGLVIVDDVIYTSGRDQITRFKDLNGDGEADVYENFNNQIMSTRGFHEFVFDLQRDDAGNFYFAKANPVNGGGRGFGDEKASRGNGQVCSHAGCLFKVSPDGKKFEILARGFRAPNGIGVRGDGQVTTSDNEGTWVPTTPINWVTPGSFSGVSNNLTPKDLAERWTPPLAWLSHQDVDNSGGGQIWVTSKNWGPFEGEMLHESYGKSSLFLVMKESVSGGRMQGGVVRFPLKFTSSVMRAKFHPKDGQLYVAGLSEWQSNAAKITGFDRVRYTGKPVYSVRGVRAVPGGVQLSFTQPLDPASVKDLQNWSGKRWNYLRTESYGSPELQVKDPSKKGRETIDITGVDLSSDGKTVKLSIADAKPVMQQSIKWDLSAKDGTKISQEIQHTVHEVPQNPPALN